MTQGSLVPPDEFAAYEGAVPGSAERILVMAEREQQHRQEQDIADQEASRKFTTRSQYISLGVSLVSITAAVIVVAIDGGALVASVLGGTGLTSGIGNTIVKMIDRSLQQATGDTNQQPPEQQGDSGG